VLALGDDRREGPNRTTSERVKSQRAVTPSRLLRPRQRRSGAMAQDRGCAGQLRQGVRGVSAFQLVTRVTKSRGRMSPPAASSRSMQSQKSRFLLNETNAAGLGRSWHRIRRRKRLGAERADGISPHARRGIECSGAMASSTAENFPALFRCARSSARRCQRAKGIALELATLRGRQVGAHFDLEDRSVCGWVCAAARCEGTLPVTIDFSASGRRQRDAAFKTSERIRR
jgi:hypothetical protein